MVTITNQYMIVNYREFNMVNNKQTKNVRGFDH